MAVTKGPVYVITGASRGLGLGLVKQLLKEGATVVAGARSPHKSAALQALVEEYQDTLIPVALDVSDEQSVKKAAEAITAALPEGSGVDVLINNAGVQGTAEYADMVAGFPDLPAAALTEAFQVNVVGTYMFTAALLPLLRTGELKRIVNISTPMASVTLSAEAALAPEPIPFHNAAGAYRISKAALSMATTVMANNLKTGGFTVIALNPGWVQTDMGNAGAVGFGMPQAPTTINDSVAGQLAVIQGLTPAQNGKFLSYDGEPQQW